jgi:hypothetical protein
MTKPAGKINAKGKVKTKSTNYTKHLHSSRFKECSINLGMFLPLKMTQKQLISLSRIYLCFVALITLIFTSCQTIPPPSEQLTSIARSGDGCLTPCWQTIVPGQSSQEEFLKLVENMPSERFDDLHQTILKPEGTEYTWHDNAYGFFNRIRILEGRVKLLGFQPRSREYTFLMFENIWGDPSFYKALRLGIEKAYIQIILIYEDDGVVIEIWIPITASEIEQVLASCEFEIDWEAHLEKIWIYLVEPGVAGAMAQNSPIGDYSRSSHKPQPWEGENPVKLTLCP